jgi:uncharacterized RDD family membrane protein YckC
MSTDPQQFEAAPAVDEAPARKEDPDPELPADAGDVPEAPEVPDAKEGQTVVATLPAPVSSPGRRFGALMLELLLVAVTMFVGWFVWSLRTWARGQTPAKSLLSMRCIRTETGRAANWRTMALREVVGKGLLGAVTAGITVLVSGVMILRPSRTGIWDRLAGTLVVDDFDNVLGRGQVPSSRSDGEAGGSSGRSSGAAGS